MFSYAFTIQLGMDCVSTGEYEEAGKEGEGGRDRVRVRVGKDVVWCGRDNWFNHILLP